METHTYKMETSIAMPHVHEVDSVDMTLETKEEAVSVMIREIDLIYPVWPADLILEIPFRVGAENIPIQICSC